MRYTTIIDISEIPRLYNNYNAVRMYLHFALKCGYHDNDRDMITVSIRQLSRTLHMTIAATRHALHLLIACGMLTSAGGSTYQVTKWVTTKTISKRAKTEAEAQARDAREAEERARAERHRKQAAEDRKREAQRKQGKTSFITYYEETILPAAERGDPEALRLKEVHRKAYEEQIAILRQEIKNALK